MKRRRPPHHYNESSFRNNAIYLSLILGSSLNLFHCKNQQTEETRTKSVQNKAQEEVQMEEMLLDTASFYTIEELLRTMALTEQKEMLLMNDGGTWYSIAKNATQYRAWTDKEPIFFILNYSPEPVLYLYHQHTLIQDSESGELLDSIHPPSSKDILFHTKLKNESEQYGKRIISRVVDMYGVWTYDTDNIAQQELFGYEGDLFTSIESERVSSQFDEKVLAIIKEHANKIPSEQKEALLPLYEESGVTLHFTEF